MTTDKPMAVAEKYHKNYTVTQIEANAKSKATEQQQEDKEAIIEWYKQGRNPNKEMPRHNGSITQFNQQKKYWAKPDELFLNDVSTKPARADSFKENRRIQLKNHEMKASCDKITARLVPDSKPPSGRPLTSTNPYRAEVNARFSTAALYYKGLLRTTQNMRSSTGRITTHNIN